MHQAALELEIAAEVFLAALGVGTAAAYTGGAQASIVASFAAAEALARDLVGTGCETFSLYV